jgi:hypothetical protein
MQILYAWWAERGAALAEVLGVERTTPTMPSAIH